ncbi:hypothetical protein CEXT_369751 [Caerostris extrusa]|uniref:Uncharacterized protein n=1 Tax=Caerostris extrusa TaxID=172846 RepID=A0AAV4UPR4_CAEEX|nr:hypothetical protein CEXT_369751 [Caerostris extrusa]
MNSSTLLNCAAVEEEGERKRVEKEATRNGCSEKLRSFLRFQVTKEKMRIGFQFTYPARYSFRHERRFSEIEGQQQMRK